MSGKVGLVRGASGVGCYVNIWGVTVTHLMPKVLSIIIPF